MTATATPLHERWCTQHVDTTPDLGAEGWCATETETHGVYVELVSDVDEVEGGMGVRISAETGYLGPAQVIEVGADMLGKAARAAGHGALSATVVRNLTTIIAARGAVEINDLEPLAAMFGVTVDHLVMEDPSA